MSKPTLTNPEVLTDHTDVVCPTGIERAVAGRNTALTQIEALFHQINDASIQTLSIGGETTLDWVMKQDFRYGYWLMEKPETVTKAIIRNPDRSKWWDLVKCSGILSIMDVQAYSRWYNSLKRDNTPMVSEANILSTSKQLRLNKGEVLQCDVINVFRGLSWNFGTSSPCGFGVKITVMGLVKLDRWGFRLNHG